MRMTTTKALAVAVAACAALACVATAQSLVLQPEAQSALFTLAGTHDELEHTWQQYEALVLSKTRSTPLVLFFEGDDSAAACAEVNDDNSSSEEEEEEKESEDDDDADESEVSTAAQTCRTAHAEQRELLRAAMTTVARAYKASGLQILRVPTQFLPRMARYHRVATATPSLLWLGPRTARGFQRYPHPETNALDLSSPSTLLASAASRSQSAADNEQRPQDALAAITSEFVRQWFIKSGLAPASSARTGVVPPAAASSSSSSSSSDELSVMEFVPLLGLMAFLGVVAYDNRALLHRTLSGRFVWFVWSAGVTYAAYSGVFHSLIHRAPLFYFSPHFGLYLFHPSGRRQFVLEGLVSGAWSFCVSLGAFSIVEILPMQRSPVARTDVFWFSVLIIGVACALVHVTFMTKTPWLSA